MTSARAAGRRSSPTVPQVAPPQGGSTVGGVYRGRQAGSLPGVLPPRMRRLVGNVLVGNQLTANCQTRSHTGFSGGGNPLHWWPKLIRDRPVMLRLGENRSVVGNFHPTVLVEGVVRVLSLKLGGD